MRDTGLGLAALLAVGIIVIGGFYLARPRVATAGFGLPLPEDGPNMVWWLRLKGVRDIVSGLAVFALMIWVDPRAVGVLLTVEALIPIGDMLVVLAAQGSTKTALGVHGATAVVMLVAAALLALGGS